MTDEVLKRELLTNKVERLILIRKEGMKKALGKRGPKGHVLTHQRELNTTDRYRTPMDDSGHLWKEDTRFFRCGRYVEYPAYYKEDWDLIFGVYWVQLDARKEDGNICSLCKAKRSADEAYAKMCANDFPRAAIPFAIASKRGTSQGRTRPVNEDVARWIGKERARLLDA